MQFIRNLFFFYGSASFPQIDNDLQEVMVNGRKDRPEIWSKSLFYFFRNSSSNQFKKLALLASLKVPLEFAAVFFLGPLVHSLEAGRSADALALMIGLVVGLILHGINQNHYFHTEFIMMNIIERLGILRIFSSRRVHQIQLSTHDVPILVYTPILFAEIFACSGIILLGVTILFFKIGFAALVAVFMIALVSPIAARLRFNVQKQSDRLAKSRGERVSFITNLALSIPIIRAFRFEDSFLEKFTKLRRQEELDKRSLLLSTVLPSLIFYFSSSLVYLVTFAVYLWMGNKLTAEVVFSSFLILKIIDFPISSISRLAISFAKTTSSFNRLKEIEDISNENRLDVRFETTGVVLAEKEIRLAEGTVVGLWGANGSGKSYFAHQIFDSLSSRYKVHLVSQNPAILGLSLFQNISLRSKASEHSVLEWLHFAEITKDEFEKDIRTLNLDANGSNISGGQRQRIAIARAFYSEPDVLIFDDSLSGVDPLTRERLFRKIVALKKNYKFIFWVTNSRIEAEFCDTLIHFENRKWSLASIGEKLISGLVDVGLINNSEDLNVMSPIEAAENKPLTSADPANDTIYFFWKNIGKYIWSFNSKPFPFEVLALILLAVLCIVVGNLQNIFLQLWTVGEGSMSYFGEKLVRVLNYFQLDSRVNISGLSIFAFLVFLSMLFTAFRLIAWEIIAIRAGGRIVKKSVNAVLRSSILFDKKIGTAELNQRLIDDFRTIDDEAQSSISESFSSIILYLTVASTVFLFSFKFLGLYLIFAVVWIYFFTQFLRRNYANRKIAIKKKGAWIDQLNSWGKSSQSINHAGAGQFLLEQLGENLESYQSSQLQINAIKRWFLGLSPLLGGLLLFSVMLTILTSSEFGPLAGIVVAFSVHQWMLLNSIARSLDEVQTYGVSIQRVFELQNSKIYSDSFPNLADEIVKIQMKNLGFGYNQEVLKIPELNLKSGELIAVKGRTGVGKSTLVKGLLGFCRRFSGELRVNDRALTAGESLLPYSSYLSQDPVFLTETLRSEMAVVGYVEVEKIIKFFTTLGLERLTLNLEQDLHAFSLGDQQLICLARTLASPKSVIILDEVTSKLDSNYEQIIISLLAGLKKGRIVFVISHRAEINAYADRTIKIADGFAREVMRSDFDPSPT